MRELTYLHVPGDCGPLERLPQALRFFPLWGLVCGGLLWLAAWALYPGSFRVAALVLVGLDLTLGGLYILRQVMLCADGRASLGQTDLSWLPRSLGAVVAGLLWLLLLYAGYFSLLRAGDRSPILLAPVVSRWLFCWLVRVWPQARPGLWHTGFDRRCFFTATILALLPLLLFSALQLLWALLPAVLGVALFALGRSRRLGGLTQDCYGFAAGWGQVLFLWGWLLWEGLGGLLF